MKFIRDKDGNVIHRSRNLAGVRRYARECQADKIDCSRLEGGGGKLSILFADRSSFECDFASFSVLVRFVLRWRAVYGASLRVNGESLGDLSHELNPKLNPKLQEIADGCG